VLDARRLVGRAGQPPHRALVAQPPWHKHQLRPR
jgi:hypothetical protein